ncbi:MAG TPA: ABC transporter substrate-binding protein, partial [Acidimicrobiales bacterium]|nr:ABC transporter substrate-binding protein [Acidimicrobiales bacterium]
MKLRSAGVLTVALALVGLSACGTRLPNSAFEASATQQQVAARTQDTGGDTSGGLGDTTETTAVSDTGSSGSSGSNGSSGGGSGNSSSTPGDNAPNKASDVGVTATSITLGTIVAENGVLGDAFAPTARGMRAGAAYMNAHGGIHGRQIDLKTCDDREDRNRDLQCAQQLVEHDKVFALVATNSRAFGGSAQYLADHEIPVIGEPITNSFTRYPTMFSVYQNGYKRDGKTAGYNGQLVNTSGIYRWFKQNMNLTKAAVFDYDIDESKQAGQFMLKGLQLEGFSTTEYTVSFAAPSFDQAVADMQRQGTQIMFDAMDD